MMETTAAALAIIRKGHCYIAHPEIFNLADFAAIAKKIPFKIKLEQDYFREGDWVITCKEIMDEHHNSFWAGQESKDQNNNAEIPNPTKWRDAWQHSVNPTWRSR